MTTIRSYLEEFEAHTCGVCRGPLADTQVCFMMCDVPEGRPPKDANYPHVAVVVTVHEKCLPPDGDQRINMMLAALKPTGTRLWMAMKPEPLQATAIFTRTP